MANRFGKASAAVNKGAASNLLGLAARAACALRSRAMWAKRWSREVGNAARTRTTKYMGNRRHARVGTMDCPASAVWQAGLPGLATVAISQSSSLSYGNVLRMLCDVRCLPGRAAEVTHKHWSRTDHAA